MYCKMIATILLLMIESNFGELPTCVDIVEVVPVSFKYSEHRLTVVFVVTFSKQVGRFDYHKAAFITPSLTHIFYHYNRHWRYFGSSLRQHEITFIIDIFEYKVYKSIFLVIDGGHILASEEHYLERNRGKTFQFVPLSIFGPYHIENSSFANHIYKPIRPSPYCYKQSKRLFQRPFVNDINVPINVTISQKNNRLLEHGQLHLSLTVSRTGKKTFKVPDTTTAIFNGRKVSVMIPTDTTITVHRRDTLYKIPITVTVIHELVERMYHIPFYGAVPIFKSSFPPRPSTDYLYTKYGRSRYEYDFGVKQNKSIIFIRSNGEEYISYSTSMHKKASHKRNPPHTFKRQMCRGNSARSMSGRVSPVYHSIELGPYYLLITPNLYTTYKPKSKNSITIKLNDKDITSRVALFKNESKGRYSVVPDYFHTALEKYVLISPALTNERNQMAIARNIIKSSVLVPRKFIEKGICYGVNLFLNHSIIKNDKKFCRKPFGDCIGLPFTSKLRFPDIPLFHKDDNIQIETNRRYLIIDKVQSIPLTVHNINIEDAEILPPQFDPSSCEDIWNLESSYTSNARLILSITNKGQGGADLRIVVKCSSLLDLYPMTGIRKKWIGPGDTYTTDYQLDSVRAVGTDQNIHKCEMKINYHLVEPQTIACSQVIRTFSGLFQDPCAGNESTLPDYSLRYFILPSSQIQPSLLTLNSFLKSPVGFGLVFMRAITVSLVVRIGQDNLVPNLNMLRISCLKGVVMVLEEHQLMDAITNSRLIDKGQAIGSALNYTSSLTLSRKIYFFAKRSWVASVTNSSSRVPSGCTVELFANRPVQQCVSNPVKLKTLIVPMVETEIKVLKEIVQAERWYLDVLYGSMISMEAMHTLIGCLVLSVLMIVVTIISYTLLFLFRKKLPSKAYFKMLEDTLNKDTTKENKRWENPQMYLEMGSQGTYYTLYNFKCTHPIQSLTQDTLKELKVAGLLRYKEKELQVLFGHVKKIFFSKSGPILLQASSGMYLLKPQNVHEEFKTELSKFYTKKKIAIKKKEE